VSAEPVHLLMSAAGQALTTARWRIHDDLVRGNPIRTERP